MNRRDFLKTAAATAGIAALPRSLGAQSSNEKIRVGIIGCGGMAYGHLCSYLDRTDVDVIALADVDSRQPARYLARIKEKRNTVPKVFQDFRKLLEMKEIDAVSVGTPDHWHALCAVHACMAGKDVYCEKPIAHNIVEGRAMVNAMKRNKRVVQIGTQLRSCQHLREAAQIVKSGILGRIHETQTWTVYNDNGLPNRPDEPPPKELDYDMWLGPAPFRPFNRLRYHHSWRWFWDYGGGKASDINVHIHDFIHLGMDSWSPTSVVSVGHLQRPDQMTETPNVMRAVYEYGHERGPFTQLFTTNGTNNYPPDGNKAHSGRGILFHGEKGTLFAGYGGWNIIPEGDRVKPQEATGSFSLQPHIDNFIDCIRSRGKPRSDVESMHLTSAACHLANISYRVGRRIYWDAENERCFRDPELKNPDSDANNLLGREHRKPWTLPG